MTKSELHKFPKETIYFTNDGCGFKADKEGKYTKKILGKEYDLHFDDDFLNRSMLDGELITEEEYNNNNF